MILSKIAARQAAWNHNHSIVSTQITARQAVSFQNSRHFNGFALGANPLKLYGFKAPFRGEIWVEKWQPESFKAPLGAKYGLCFAPKGAFEKRCANHSTHISPLAGLSRQKQNFYKILMRLPWGLPHLQCLPQDLLQQPLILPLTGQDTRLQVITVPHELVEFGDNAVLLGEGGKGDGE